MRGARYGEIEPRWLSRGEIATELPQRAFWRAIVNRDPDAGEGRSAAADGEGCVCRAATSARGYCGANPGADGHYVSMISTVTAWIELRALLTGWIAPALSRARAIIRNTARVAGVQWNTNRCHDHWVLDSIFAGNQLVPPSVLTSTSFTPLADHAQPHTSMFALSALSKRAPARGDTMIDSGGASHNGMVLRSAPSGDGGTGSL